MIDFLKLLLNLVLFIFGRHTGKESEREKRLQDNLDATERSKKMDKHVDDMSDDERREWLRDQKDG